MSGRTSPGADVVGAQWVIGDPKTQYTGVSCRGGLAQLYC